MMKAATSLILLAAALSLGGCINLDPTPDPTRFYVLGTVTGSESEVSNGGVTVGIREIGLPEYLMSSRIALRKGAHQIIYLPFERWGEDVAVSAARALATQLQAAPGTGRVSTFPWGPAVDPDFVVRVEFSHFEGSVDGHVYVSGRWTIIEPARNAVVASQSFSFPGRWDTTDYGDLAQALNASLQRVGQAISDAVAELPPPVR